MLRLITAGVAACSLAVGTAAAFDQARAPREVSDTVKVRVPDQPEYSLEGIEDSPVVMQARWYAWASKLPPPPPPRPKSTPVVQQRSYPSSGGSVDWDGIAKCETSWDSRNPNKGQAWWGMTGSTYSGGLGFYNGTWDSFGGREFASNAGLATREQQIIVAERVYARHGLSGWGCKAYG